MQKETQTLLFTIRAWIGFMIFGIAISGITAFPLVTELAWLNSHSQAFPAFLRAWISRVATGVIETNKVYPFLAYGTDWLAFAHIMIAAMFIGPFRDPIKNRWVIEWGMIACVSVIPLALICGPVRDIPFQHQLIDCSFGVVGIIPLIIVRNKIKRLEQLANSGN
jgi:hypothetical protein